MITDKAIEYITELFMGNSGGHDKEHTLRVYHNAMQIADGEAECDREIVALAALLQYRNLFSTFMKSYSS